jgi:VWFA-related protein
MRCRIALRVVIVPLVCAAGVSGPALRAQSQQPFKSKIELVRVDAVVVDKDGKAVRGLASNDFVLSDRKKKQTIATFDEVSHERAAPTAASTGLPITLKRDVASNADLQTDRLVLLVVDDLHIWRGRTDKAKELAREVVAKLGDHASMALLFTSGEHSTLVTQDRSELLAAIDGMKARQSWRRPHQANDDQKAAVNPAVTGGVDSGLVELAQMDNIVNAQQASLQDSEENMQEFKVVEDAARFLLAEDQRRKSFVLVSEGLVKGIFPGLFEMSGNVEEMGGGSATGASPLKVMGYHNDALRDMMRSMRRSGVALYSLDPRGKVEPGQELIESWPPITCAVCMAGKAGDDVQFRWDNPVRLAQDALRGIADASGGFAVTDTDDLSAGIDRIVEDIDHYYLLGFYPQDTGGNSLRPLNVTVPGHPEYKVRFRFGYVPNGAVAPPKNKDPLVELSAGVMPKSDLPLRLTALPLTGPGAQSSVNLMLEVTAPTGELKTAGNKLQDDISYALLVIDEKKANVTERQGRAASFVMSGADAAKPMPDSVTYQVPLAIDLAPGRYQLRASAISRRLDLGGSVFISIVVPDYSKELLAVTPIALGLAEGPHVPVGRPAAGVVSRLPFEPTVSRTFEFTDTLRAYFEVARVDTASTVRLTIAILDRDDGVMWLVEKSVVPGDSGRVDVKVPLESLGPAAFRLRVTANDGRAVATSETGFIIK